ncbi:MAG: hypothetical protein IMZ61_13905 [Planctomycetes bacterium]|nr:hypothetical protein [Chloroflexota bacterium]MBE3144992.1 hypothetical protein [Planctomycetota bacterium]
MPDKEKHECSGTLCHACSNDGCCDEQKEWDKVIEQDELEQTKPDPKE